MYKRICIRVILPIVPVEQKSIGTVVYQRYRKENILGINVILNLDCARLSVRKIVYDILIVCTSISGDLRKCNGGAERIG